MPSIRQVIRQTQAELESTGIPDARLEAEVMVMNVMRMARQDLFSQQETELSAQQEQDLAQFMERRRLREPLAFCLFLYWERSS